MHINLLEWTLDNFDMFVNHIEGISDCSSDGRKMSDMTTGKFFQVDFAITGDGHFLQLCRFITHRMVKTSCHQVVLFGCQKPLVDRTIHKHTKNGVSFKLNRLDSMSMSMQYFRIHVI